MSAPPPEPAEPPPPKGGRALLSRRTILWAGLGSAALLGAGGLALHLDPPAEGLRALSAADVRVVEKLAAVLFPAGNFPVTGGDGGTAPLVDAILADAFDPAAVRPFRTLLRALELSTQLIEGARFTALSDAGARAVFHLWCAPEPMPRRLASDSLKVVVGMGFLRRPEVVAAIGWRVGCRAAPAPPPGTSGAGVP